jgi:hypothetical protein
MHAALWDRRAVVTETDLQQAATESAIEYLYSNAREDPEFQLQILARLVKANGCTGVPDFCFKRCCDEHDVAYHTGKDQLGNDISRPEADRKLMRCIDAMALEGETEAQRVLAPIYFVGVRVFGESHWFDYVPPTFNEPLGD